jgi:hypothetical protein|tara:strand:+ start:429 stop:590 length:162 start_codon:yes stop_codon:yes gene_type:complete
VERQKKEQAKYIQEQLTLEALRKKELEEKAKLHEVKPPKPKHLIKKNKAAVAK